MDPVSLILATAIGFQAVRNEPESSAADSVAITDFDRSRTDRWATEIVEAAHRFGIPDIWILAVMQAESNGQAGAISPKGAVGLMQLMPETYAEMRAKYGLGGDPFDPRDNILAGAAYLREMLDRYGTPGFLAAYNAGPARLEGALAGRQSLPEETRDFLNSVGRRIGLSDAALAELGARSVSVVRSGGLFADAGSALRSGAGEPSWRKLFVVLRAPHTGQ